MKHRKLITGVFAISAMGIMILDSRCMLISTEQGVKLCLNSLIPSLFPFLFLSAIVTDAFWEKDGVFFRFLGRLFQIPAGGSSLLIPALLGGYPAGAQTIAENYETGRLSGEEAQRLLAYCNNAGPSFLFGIVAFQFPEPWMAWSLWVIHILSAAMVSRFYPMGASGMHILARKEQSISAHLIRSLRTMAMICGWVILFRVLLGFLDKWFLWYFPKELRIAVWGILELSNGCCSLTEIASIPMRFILCSGMLSFGGICITMQTASLISDLSLSGYLKGKMIQTGFSLVFAAFAIFGYGWIVAVMAFLWLISPRLRKKEVAFCGISLYNTGIIRSEGAI